MSNVEDLRHSRTIGNEPRNRYRRGRDLAPLVEYLEVERDAYSATEAAYHADGRVAVADAAAAVVSALGAAIDQIKRARAGDWD